MIPFPLGRNLQSFVMKRHHSIPSQRNENFIISMKKPLIQTNPMRENVPMIHGVVWLCFLHVSPVNIPSQTFLFLFLYILY
jgi:hypothetical protein